MQRDEESNLYGAIVVRSGGIAYVSKLYVRVRHSVPPCCRWLQNTAPEQRPQRTAAAFRSWLHYRYLRFLINRQLPP